MKKDILPKPSRFNFPSRVEVLRNGTKLHFIDLPAKGSEKGTVLCVHGFPDSWFGYRKVIPAIADAGYRVIVPDQRGYGTSSAPRESSQYQMKLLIEDNLALLDFLKINKTIIIGHDWGGTLVWNFAVHYPERIAAICGICTPFFPVNTKKNPWEAMKKNPGRFDYQMYFQTDEAEREMNRNPKETVKRFFVAEDTKSSDLGVLLNEPSKNGLFKTKEKSGTFLDEDELEYYAKSWENSGSFGPLSWYRNVEANWKWSFEVEGKKVTMPSLMIAAAGDVILPPSMVESVRMKDHCTDLKVEVVDGCGHWILQQKPEETSKIITAWLKAISPQIAKSKL